MLGNYILPLIQRLSLGIYISSLTIAYVPSFSWSSFLPRPLFEVKFHTSLNSSLNNFIGLPS